MTTFDDFASAASDEDRLSKAYDRWVTRLLDRAAWSQGRNARRRIPWRRGEDARDELAETFDSPGIYLWGALGSPLYVGMTRSAFQSRFQRYIWGKRSQCKLAARYEDDLIEHGIDGFPDDVRDWYANFAGSSTVRLDGAVAFARAGIDDVWFALMPADRADNVKDVEEALIPVAASWNRERGHPELLNVEHK